MASALGGFSQPEPLQSLPEHLPTSNDYLGLKVLYLPLGKDDGANEISIDIVAVHGVGADPYYSWVTNKVHWLENIDMLPSKMQTARIMSFGYESQWFGAHAIKISLSSVAEDLLGDLQAERMNCSDRPLIFIGHCFGGLVIQQVLLNARLRELQSIFDRTVGVAFLGTPFRGTGEITAQGLLHAAVAARCEVQPAVLDHLQREDASLNFVVQGFLRLCNDTTDSISLVCFYEQKETKVGQIVGDTRLREFVVDKASGCIDGSPNFGLGLDHFQLNKFPSADNVYYKRVVRELLKLQKSNESQVIALPPPLAMRTPLFLVPFERDEQFVGRKNVLSQIGKGLQASRRVAIHGLGGIGKSQVAIEFAYRFREDNPNSHVFWIYAANSSRFDQAYKNLGRRLDLPRIDDSDVDMCDIVSAWLSENENEEWLMILDNADDDSLFFPTTDVDTTVHPGVTEKPLYQYLPRVLGPKQYLLITTRDRSLGLELSHGADCIEILQFASDESITLLQTKGGSIAQSWNAWDMEKLVKMLEYHSLAISQAAAYMKTYQIPVTQYLDLLEKSDENMKHSLSTERRDHRREQGIPHSVSLTLRATFNLILQKNARVTEMLSLIAMLDRQGIPEHLLRQQGESDFAFRTAVGSLDNLSLITREVGKESLAIHRLVQLSVQAWLEHRSQITRYMEDALALVSAAFSLDYPDREGGSREMHESLIPHARLVLRYDTRSGESFLQRMRLLHYLSRFDLEQRRYNLARPSALEACTIMKELLGEEDPYTLTSRHLLASALHYAGNYKAAKEMFQQLVPVAEILLGEEHPHTLSYKQDLERAVRDCGNMEEAEEIYRRIPLTRGESLRMGHSDTLTIMHSLAVILDIQEKHEEAQELSRLMLENGRRVIGAQRPGTLAIMPVLAMTQAAQGKFKESEETSRQNLDSVQNVLGAESRDTLFAMSYMALNLLRQGQLVQAEEHLLHILDASERIYGEKHPHTLSNMLTLAMAWKFMGKIAQAIESLRKIVVLQKEMLGEDHPTTIWTVQQLHECITETGVDRAE